MESWVKLEGHAYHTMPDGPTSLLLWCHTIAEGHTSLYTAFGYLHTDTVRMDPSGKARGSWASEGARKFKDSNSREPEILLGSRGVFK